MNSMRPPRVLKIKPAHKEPMLSALKDIGCEYCIRIETDEQVDLIVMGEEYAQAHHIYQQMIGGY